MTREPGGLRGAVNVSNPSTVGRFWVTADALTDFEDQLESVSEPVFVRRPETVIPIHLRRQEVEAVKRVAKTRGIREAALLRQWVREKLRDAKS